MVAEKDRYLTISRAAEIKGCSRGTVYNLIKRRQIRTYEIAGKQFVINDEIFAQTQINRGVPFSRLEERLGILEAKVSELEKENKALKTRLDRVESRRGATKVRRN